MRSRSALLLVLLFAACGGGKSAPSTATLSGRLLLLESLPLGPAPARVDSAPRDAAEFVPGQIVVFASEGVEPERLAAHAGLACLRASGEASLMCVPHGSSDADGLRDLKDRCAQLVAAGVARFAEPNYLRRLSVLPGDPLFDRQWALEQIRAPAAWDRATGDGVIVAVVDSGIRAGHPDLAGRVLEGYDFLDGDADPNDPGLFSSHGTQTAGIIAAATDNGIGVSGILWSGRILPLRTFGVTGFGSSYDIAQAIRYAAGLENDSGTLPLRRADVINLSFASDVPTQIEREACDAARAAGVVLVAAAGNEASGTPRYPAAYDSVLAVAATTSSGASASYSNYGDWIDLAAPGGAGGAGIRTTGIGAQGSYTYPAVSGTSFAAPHVAGVAALVLGIAARSPQEVEQILTGTAQDIGPAGFDARSGHGIVDAYAAVLAALDEPAPLLRPGETIHVRLLAWPALDVAFASTTTEAQALDWSLEGVRPGEYLLEAGTDRNFDGVLLGPGEVAGRWTDGSGGEVLRVTAPGTVSGLDFTIAPQ